MERRSQSQYSSLIGYHQVDYGTWFGGNVEFIHCIQMLPFTPITEELLREEWVQEEYPVLAQVSSHWSSARPIRRLRYCRPTRAPTRRCPRGGRATS